MGTGICLLFHWENDIYVNGTGNCTQNMETGQGFGQKEVWEMGFGPGEVTPF